MGPLDPTRLYLGDNGRALCGSIECAGATAFYSGRDLSGQKVMSVSPALARELGGLRCEGCGFDPARLEELGRLLVD